MATTLTKAVTRKTAVETFDRGKSRSLIVSIEPAGRDNAVIGIRIAGTRDTYRLGVQTVLNMAITKHHDDVRRKAQKLHKEGTPMRSAKAQAKRELAKELRK